VCAAGAQALHLGNINFYGLHKLTAERILRTIHAEPGGALPPSKGDLEDQIAALPGVVAVYVEAVCCEGTAADLFIGVEEQGAPHAAFRSPPAGGVSLPQALLDTYQQYLSAVQRAAVKGTGDEDMSAGHALMADPVVRALQEGFIVFARDHLNLLHEVVRNGSVAEQRAIAATVMGYAPRKAGVVDDLQFAVDDSDGAVRANAMKALTAIAVLAQKSPELRLQISPTWFVEMLNSVVLSDRVEATRALVTLTNTTNVAALALIRERALASVLEMARWKSLRYALPSFILAGRLAGLTDAQTHQSWEKGDRAAVLDKVQSPGRAGKK
jgi:hypothetical protein